MSYDSRYEPKTAEELDEAIKFFELERNISKVLMRFAESCLDPKAKTKLQPRIDEIINLFRKYGGKI